ncbi:uncharacterized protein [Dysidea avara]|uniref:uncharacterized protein isoform X2 n=1 Tax=Dysidea avara TaxID=196820 RepID=UPI003320FC3D
MILIYRMIYNDIGLELSDFFSTNTCSSTRGHTNKFFKPRAVTRPRSNFFAECTDIEQITQETLELKAKTCFKVGILTTQLKEELRNETGECVTEGTRRSSKLVSEEASYTVCEEGEVHKQQTAVKVVITQGDTDKKELEDKIHLLQ